MVTRLHPDLCMLPSPFDVMSRRGTGSVTNAATAQNDWTPRTVAKALTKIFIAKVGSTCFYINTRYLFYELTPTFSFLLYSKLQIDAKS